MKETRLRTTSVASIAPGFPQRIQLDTISSSLSEKLAGEEGFEPSLPGPEPGVLPLDYSPATPQKKTGIGQKIQSLLPNPLIAQFYCLDPLGNQSILQPVLKYQPRHLWPAGILLASSTRAVLYNGATDNGNETIPLAAPPTPRETIPRSADETDMMMMAPSTLPESVTEVASC